MTTNMQSSESDILAISVKNVYFGYVSGAMVIKNLSMKVEQGGIFALLGSNGCGKTTLLKMILGRILPDLGSIRLFNMEPHSRHSDIPGPGVGYMPQEIALFDEFTIEEMLTYFGKIFHMKAQEIKTNIEELKDLLNIPEKSRLIAQLSGGQKRLVSIAVTIIHKPKLIILDEPTVGVDSLLRSRIWSYLEDLCSNHGKTVIITTHYIEEAKNATTVAFMKSGGILKQSDPRKLMNDYQCSTLEAVYLTLWKRNEQMLTYRRRSTIMDIEGDLPKDIDLYRNIQRQSSHNYMRHTIDMQRILALIWKFIIRSMRSPFVVFLFNVVPLIAISSLYYSLGQLPYDIPVSVYNGESVPILSNQFIDTINKRFVRVKRYNSLESAIDSVVEGKNVFAIAIADNFTQTLESRLKNPFKINMSESEINSSTIRLYSDFSNSIVGAYVIHYLGEAFLQFMGKVSSSLGLNSNFSMPLQIQPPVYGDNFWTYNQIENLKTFSDFVTPGALIILFHLASMAYSAFSVIYDRKDSHFDRFYVAGGQPIEVLIAHYIQHLFLSIVQILIAMVFSFSLFDITQSGSYAEVYAICVLQSAQGMTIGLLVSLLFYDEISVAVGLSALMFPIWIMSGVFWPLEAIPYYFRLIADWTPLTKPIDALRSVMTRSWTYRNPSVMIGYAVSLSYTSLLTIASVLLYHTFAFKTISLSGYFNFSSNKEL